MSLGSGILKFAWLCYVFHTHSFCTPETLTGAVIPAVGISAKGGNGESREGYRWAS